MAQCQFIWESFKKNICEGFSNLQQHEELVDMTLVAEGHIVKVHKSLLALASPYLKAIIQSAQYQHPIVFLTHIRHEILGYILEYVYTGEVAVPCDDMAEFIEACKSLHISGARDLIPPAQKNKVEDRNNVKLNKEQNPHSKEEHCAAGRKRKRRRLQEERYIERDDLEDLNKETIEQTDVENFIRNVNVIAPPVIPIINTNVSMVNNYRFNEEDGSEDLNKHSSRQIDLTNVGNFIQNVDVIPLTDTNFSNISQPQQVEPEIAAKGVEYLGSERECEPENEKPVTDLLNYNEMDIDDEDYDDGEAVTFENGSQPFETLSSMNMDNSESKPKNNYSINIEMPNDNKGPPKITIQAGILDNLPNTSDSVLIERLQGSDEELTTTGTTIPKIIIHHNDIIKTDPVPSEIGQNIGNQGTSANTTSIPRIIIDAGKIKDLPSTSSAKVTDIVPVAKTAKTRPKVDVILPTNKVSSKLAKKFGNSLSPYYMLSSKNCIQMILNRFIYNLHHQAKREKKMRWRCADYRHRRCPAYIDTIDAVISKRQFAHNHSFHDDKIMDRGSSQKIYETFEEVKTELERRQESAFPYVTTYE